MSREPITLKRWAISSGDAASTFINNFLFLANDGNQSLSGRCWDERDHWFFGKTLMPVINGFFYVVTLGKQKNHCKLASENDTRRACERVKRASDEGFGVDGSG